MYLYCHYNQTQRDGSIYMYNRKENGNKIGKQIRLFILGYVFDTQKPVGFFFVKDEIIV